MQIAFSGRLGSGKSTVCEILKEKYGYEIYSTGSIQRKIAAEMGITTLELNKRCKSDPKLDHIIDDTVTQISRERKGEKLIFDSRMAWHFAENVFKVYMYVDPTIAATRVFGTDRGTVEKYENIDDAREQLLARTFEENDRFKIIYGVDNLDFSNYDLILDSTLASPEEIADAIVINAQEFEENPFETRVFLAPCSISCDDASCSKDDGITVTFKNGLLHCLCGKAAVSKAEAENKHLISVMLK